MKTIWEVIEKFKKSALLQSRYVGSAPTYEWTGYADLQLLGYLDTLNISFTQFISDVKGQSLYGKKCVCFTTFGSPQN